MNVVALVEPEPIRGARPRQQGHGGYASRWLRRARPALGTLVEVHLPAPAHAPEAFAQRAFEQAFGAIAEVQSCLSRFEPGSDIARFNGARAGTRLSLHAHSARVLGAAKALRQASRGMFDITLGSAPEGWCCEGAELHKLDAAARLDLGGIGKGYAVDCAVEALIGCGCCAGWVNAGGDLRVFGSTALPLHLRDEHAGGMRPFAMLRDGAFATSHFGPGSRSQASAARRITAHVSVAAPSCLWADALTKLVAISGDTLHPLLARHGAMAWRHR